MAQSPPPGATKFWQNAALHFIALILLLIKTAVIRPLLAVHTDQVLRFFSGGSTTHYYYIGVEAVLFVVLLLLMVSAIRGLIRQRLP